MKRIKCFKRRITKLDWIIYCLKLLTQGLEENLKYIDKDKRYDN